MRAWSNKAPWSPPEVIQTRNFRLLRDDRTRDSFFTCTAPQVHWQQAGGLTAVVRSTLRCQTKFTLWHLIKEDSGCSAGVPSKPSVLNGAVTVFKRATEVASVSPQCITIFGRSLGSAVAIALVEHLAAQSPPVLCAGLVVTAPLSDVTTFTATYRLGCVFPVLSPVTFSYFTDRLSSTWLNKDRIRIAQIVWQSSRYHINIIHAEDDPEIPHSHSNLLFWHAVNTANTQDLCYETLEEIKALRKTIMGEGGWFIEWPTEKGITRQDMLRYGLRDKISL